MILRDNLIKSLRKCSQRSADFSFLSHIVKRKLSKFPFPSHNVNVPRLSPAEVTRVLQELEFTYEFQPGGGPIKSFDTNQLKSNDPMEDMRAEAVSLHDGGMYLGVFDGHAGAACAQVLAKRLFSYMEAALLSKAQLSEALADGGGRRQLIESINDHTDFVRELKEKYEKSFLEHLRTLAGRVEPMDRKEALEYSCLRLDEDLSREAVQENGQICRKGITVCMSGAVGCVAHISSSELYLASVGDCQAVIGQLSESKQWTAKKLNLEHNTDNLDEVKRILSEHPPSERSTVISNERLLGQLAPLRAFGDFRYKWSSEKLAEFAVPLFGESAIAPHYLTPPYLTARPDVTRHRLTPRDKFIVIASDGLWELLSPLQVVRMVGEHMRGKAALAPLRIGHNMKLKDINAILKARQDGLNHVASHPPQVEEFLRNLNSAHTHSLFPWFSSFEAPVDRNAATHLLRNALGGTDTGLEHSRISQLLSLPRDIVRLFRDDITISVAYFDSDFISHCPM